MQARSTEVTLGTTRTTEVITQRGHEDSAGGSETRATRNPRRRKVAVGTKTEERIIAREEVKSGVVPWNVCNITRPQSRRRKVEQGDRMESRVVWCNEG